MSDGPNLPMPLPASPPAPASLRSPADRGELDIADRVVAKIAERAADEVPAVEHRSRGGLGRLFGSDAQGPTVQAKVDGTQANVTIAVGVRYPEPVWDTAAAVRDAVARRLTELAGMQTVEVSVEVTELVTARIVAPRVQ